ncbi:unnamed protein product [Schistocephalus solidus]|uniref:Uncharacterized protein n=1 Tax=Schistocephalus solidus TaxID=70667 RepID=A0A183SVQ4_SCHSO|nr:unnamed protein product [Schistocephalus solidus]
MTANKPEMAILVSLVFVGSTLSTYAARHYATAIQGSSLTNLPITDADISVENRWCQLRETIQSTAQDVLGRDRRQHQDWFDDNDAAINTLLVEKNQLHKAVIDCPTAANKTVFY